jgi:hypothetical protein
MHETIRDLIVSGKQSVAVCIPCRDRLMKKPELLLPVPVDGDCVQCDCLRKEQNKEADELRERLSVPLPTPKVRHHVLPLSKVQSASAEHLSLLARTYNLEVVSTSKRTGGKPLMKDNANALHGYMLSNGLDHLSWDTTEGEDPPKLTNDMLAAIKAYAADSAISSRYASVLLCNEVTFTLM